jgi:glycosyltransferase involved in cell wall biosynthesis
VDVVTVSGPANRWARLLGLPRLLGRIVAELARWRPATVVVEGASWAAYSWLLVRHLRRMQPRPRILYHAHNVECLLRQPRGNPAVSWITRRTEGWLVRRADRSFAVSELEADRFERLYGRRPELWPNGIDARRYAEGQAAAASLDAPWRVAGGPILLFLGGYAYGPNAEAIDFLVESVMPALLDRLPRVRLVVLGGGVPSERTWLVAPGVVAYEALPAWVHAADVGLAPVFSGAGTRVKVLEYMAAGRPVMATAKAVEGLGLTAGEDYLAAETAAQFADAVLRVLADAALARALSERGRRTVRQRFDWRAILPRCDLLAEAGA